MQPLSLAFTYMPQLAENEAMVADLNNFKNKAQTENSDLASQLENAESKISSLTKAKNDLQAQLEEAKQELESENKVCLHELMEHMC